MSAKQVCLATLVSALVGLGAAHGQYATPGSYAPTTPGAVGGMGTPQATSGSLTTRPGDSPPPQDQAQPAAGPVNLCLSEWIVGPHPAGCCDPTGANGPVQMEIYLQSGLAIPFSDGVFGHTLQTGWEIQGGGRSLFFNADETAAWVIDLSISNVYNHGRDPTFEVPLAHIFQPTATTPQNPNAATFVIVDYVPRPTLDKIAKMHKLPANGQPVSLSAAKGSAPETVAAQGVTIQELNRTFVSAGFGRDWYLYGQAPTYLNAGDRGDCDHGGPVWRIGIDGGGRYGTAKLGLQEMRHRTDTIAGLYVGAHSDVEVPCGCCIFQAGVRAEYDFVWMDILQNNDADLQDFNLLFTVGVRF